MLFLGVDGGTTKTIALVADERGKILGAARRGGSNWSGLDVSIPMGVVAEAARQALSQARAERADLGVFTLAGADWPEDHANRQVALEKAGICQRVIVKNDSFGGLRAGTSQPYGIVIAAGTGMNAAAIAPDGREWAFGYYQTDGGASDIVHQVFAAVLRAEDGRGRPTALSGLVLSHLGFPTVEAMLRAHVLKQISRQQYYGLCPLLFEAATQGDEVAVDLVVRQGHTLAEYATTLVRRFGMQSIAFDLVLAGSVFKGSGPLLADTITLDVHRAAPQARVVRSSFEPAVGSLLLAFDAAGRKITPLIQKNITASVPGADFFDTAHPAEEERGRP